MLFVALRWHGAAAPLIRDEGEYAYAAQLLRRGVAPYKHSFLQKPPMVIYTYALANLTAPKIFWAPRILAYIFTALTTILLGLIARLEFGKGFALPTMWLFTPMVLLPGLDQTIANTEMFMLLPLMACFALYILRRHYGHGHAAWFAVGFCAVVTLAYKYTSLPLLVALAAAWSLYEWRTQKNVRLLIQYWVLGFFGACVAGAGVFGFFLMRDGGRHLWECTVVFNRAYIASGNFGWNRLGYRLHALWASWWVLFLLPSVLLVKPSGRILFWLGMFVAAWLTTSASYYWQYYVPVMPFWALLTAVGAKRLAAWFSARLHCSEVQLSQGLIAFVIFVLCMADLPWLIPAKTHRASGDFNPINPFPESQIVARRVAEITSPQDWVYIAGSEPQILYYAQRFSPTRFVITYPLMIPTPLARAYQQEAIRELDMRPPAVIVRARWNTSWLKQADTPPEFVNYLDSCLAEHYERVGGYVLAGEGGCWLEPLPDRDLSDASLVLFRRKPRRRLDDP